MSISEEGGGKKHSHCSPGSCTSELHTTLCNRCEYRQHLIGTPMTGPMNGLPTSTKWEAELSSAGGAMMLPHTCGVIPFALRDT